MKYIVHIDMDAFFAAIEQRDNPKLKGKPVVVGADPKKGRGRGVVSTCSYEARKFGIHSAMPISIAYKRCPKGVFLPVNMKKYSKVSEQIYEILYDFSPKIEVVSVDEAFLDITGSHHIFGGPVETCKALKAKIKEKTRLTASVGLAPIMMAAKIASDLEKPDGLVMVEKEKLLDFLWPLDVGRIWGLGPKAKAVLNNMGIKTIGNLAKIDLERLEDVFGLNGEHFWQLANGIDQREVETEEEVKSVSNEYTFEEDEGDNNIIQAVLIKLCEKVSSRLRADSIKGRTITLKIRLEGFHTYTRARTLTGATNHSDAIYKTIKKLFVEFDRKGKKVRLVGVKVSGLIPQQERDTLFFDEGVKEKRQESIHKAIDKIKAKFCLLYTSPSPRDLSTSRMPSSA